MIVLKAPQEKLLTALQAVAGIVERRHTLPILANVLLRKTGEQIELTTSDLEIQVRTSAELGGDAGSFSTTYDRATLEAAVALAEKIDVVIHGAALTNLFARFKTIEPINVGGTRQIIELLEEVDAELDAQLAEARAEPVDEPRLIGGAAIQRGALRLGQLVDRLPKARLRRMASSGRSAAGRGR